jgi:mRNA interferase RelE/StbE
MAKVRLEDQAAQEADRLSPTILDRLEGIVERLESWPNVSGVKWLTGQWKNHARIRFGDYRVVFHIEGDEVIIDRVAHRRDVYID